ncbi:hypothetical protein JCM33374_g3829 [Metschnikowia sp. JCM 33374]|nr:hypothetical protein JCM33374_g3829 [Metschnikowia sp. JCM 33374]
MKLFTCLALPALALAGPSIIMGSMYLLDVPTKCHPYMLNVKGTAIVAKEGLQFYDYDKDTQTLKVHDEDAYVSVDEQGKLVLSSQPHGGFRWGTQVGEYKRFLSYGDNSIFQLFRDLSVGIGSDCKETRDVRVIFEDAIQPCEDK